jgi:hypothetical protein
MRPLPNVHRVRSNPALRPLITFMLLATETFGQTPAAQLGADDAVRIREFYRLASSVVYIESMESMIGLTRVPPKAKTMALAVPTPWSSTFTASVRIRDN